MSKLIEQTIMFSASPHAVYEVLMDSEKHAAFTNSQAQISREVGGDYMAYSGYISGKNLELIPDQKIRQTWRAQDWPEDQYSVVTFLLTPVETGTQLIFTHENVPDGTEDEYSEGWIENYWEPMMDFLKN